MRYVALFLLLALLAGICPYYPAYAQGYAYPPGYYPPGGPPPPPPPPPYGSRLRPYYGGGQAYNTENCGTPDAPKPCPPMPRVPLPYYPANRP